MIEDYDLFDRRKGLDRIIVDGVRLEAGDRVTIRPKKGADIMDLALAGKTATIDAIEQDVEDRIYLALILDDDPGRDLGFLKQPGHRFFFGSHEVEPIRSAGGEE